MLQPLLTTLLLFGQAPVAAPAVTADGAQETPLSTKAARLAADHAAWQAAIACAGAGDFTPTFLKASRGLIRGRGARGWYDLDGFGVREKDLRYYLEWFHPAKARDGRVPAVDLEREDHPLRAITACAAELAANGIDFVAVPVPNRLEIYPDRVPGVSLPDDYCGITPDYVRLLAALTDAGIEVVDLRPGFLAARDDPGNETDARLFMDFDHHWTPRGAALAAELVADRLRAFEWYEPGPEQEGEAFRIGREPGEIRKRLEAPGPHKGRSLAERWIFHTQSLWLRPVLRLPDGGAAQVRDRESPILLVGDSFVSIHSKKHSGFAAHLYAQLGRQLDVIHNAGGGMTVWKVVARRGETLRKKRVVIWLCTARALSEPWTQPLELFGD